MLGLRGQSKVQGGGWLVLGYVRKLRVMFEKMYRGADQPV